MFLYSLLEVSEQTTQIVKWVSVAAVLALLGVIVAISLARKTRRDTKRVAFAGVCVAMSFTLALVKFSPIQYGGSITLASFVPIMLYAYMKQTVQQLSLPEVMADTEKVMSVMSHYKELTELLKEMAKRAGDRVVLKA